MKTWVDAHPNEVVTILLTNGDNVDISKFGDAFNATGMDDLAFVPSTTPQMLPIGSWPTYGELIASGKRVVVFLDYGADATKVPYILGELLDQSISNHSTDLSKMNSSTTSKLPSRKPIRLSVNAASTVLRMPLQMGGCTSSTTSSTKRYL